MRASVTSQKFQLQAGPVAAAPHASARLPGRCTAAGALRAPTGRLRAGVGTPSGTTRLCHPIKFLSLDASASTRLSRSIGPLGTSAEPDSSKQSGRSTSLPPPPGVLASKWAALSRFQQLVYLATCRIPRGQTRSYLWVAKKIKRPGSARAVGGALHRNPFAPVVPCHRVICSDGSLGGFAMGLAKKMALLRQEGWRETF
ncbi:MAG: MGMT family protein [Candidatus Omnitrophica bacterium]|nr:MGMT family protein [Candidatus Omnitrophota bacterium]MBI3010857.1 MGMT family protein [Candidatus Omnitrophota bacterium]